MNDSEKSIFEKISFFDEDYLLELAKTQKGDLANVIRGINHHCFGIRFFNLNDICFEYINYEKELIGYSFNLKYKEKSFYNLLSGYVSFLSREFVNLDALSLYNTYIQQYRTVLEDNQIATITNKDLKKYKNLELFCAGEVEIVNFVDEIKFYRKLLNYNEYIIDSNKKYVYIMYSKLRNQFKIGISKDPNRRNKEGKTFDPDIVLLKTWEGNFKLESELKTKFFNKNIEGEWFKLSLEDLRQMNNIVNEILC